jgi:hypothetical protein
MAPRPQVLVQGKRSSHKPECEALKRIIFLHH